MLAIFKEKIKNQVSETEVEGGKDWKTWDMGRARACESLRRPQGGQLLLSEVGGHCRALSQKLPDVTVLQF